MGTRLIFSRRAFHLGVGNSHLTRRPAILPPGVSRPPPPPPHRCLHFETHQIPIPTTSTLFCPSRNVHQSLHENPKPLPSDLAVGLPQKEEEVDVAEEEDGPMNDFLSRFVWGIKQKLSDAYPGCDRETLDGMLLIIAQKVVSEMEKGGGIFPSAAKAPSTSADVSLDLSPDLWKTIWEVSNSVLEDMRKARRREEMKKFLHSEDVKEMCRFAGDVGIRGDMLRELRFKWAREKLEESEFYRNLDRVREESHSEEEAGKSGEGAGTYGAATADATDMVGEGERLGEATEKPTLTSLPQRWGKIKYKIYGLDLSEPKWAEVADKIHEAEKLIVPEEPKPIMGKCKLVIEKILTLQQDDDPSPVLAEWVELLRPTRVDWLALLDRVQEHNPALYFKVAELILSEESFQPAIRDYSKLMDVHAKANRIEDVERILQKMTEKGIKADILTSTILVHMYSKAGNLDRAKEAFESLRSQGFQPDLNAYNSMILAYVKAGLPKSGETLMREMEARDIKPTKEIYMELLRAFARLGHVDGAQRIVNTMQFAGFQPTLESCTLLVEAYGHAGDPDQARHSFDFMMKAGHKPDDRCTASMIAAYEKKNLLDKALDLLLNREKDGFKPGITTYTVLVDWLGKLQLVDEAQELLDKIAEMGDAPFHINVSLCDMYARARVEHKALKSLRILEGKIELLSADQFERIISGLSAGGLIQDAKRVHASMQARGFAPSESVRIALMANPAIPRQRSTVHRW